MTVSENLKDLRSSVEDGWFVDNPNGTDVNEEITALIEALEVCVETLNEAADKKSMPTIFELIDGARQALAKVEEILDAKN